MALFFFALLDLFLLLKVCITTYGLEISYWLSFRGNTLYRNCIEILYLQKLYLHIFLLILPPPRNLNIHMENNYLTAFLLL